MNAVWALCFVAAVQWQHPAGLITAGTLQEVRAKIDTQEWAKGLFESEKRGRSVWRDMSTENLQRVFPTVCGNVYHNFSCPTDRTRLTFDPLEPETFTCPICGKTFAAETDPGVYEESHRYHGSMYEGWACLFYQMAATVASEFAVIGAVDGDEAYTRRSVEILLLFADTLDGLTVSTESDPQLRKLLTYHREGDNKILYDLACAYEVVRDTMTAEQRARVEMAVLQRMLDDILLEPIYTYDHNNVYQWHRAIVQTALALERDDLVDWSFGFGAFDAEHQPEHRSMRRLLATHFKPDGAYWEMCSGYHLYPVSHLCEFAVLSRNLSAMDPDRFPPDQYDLTNPVSEGGAVIARALHWFMSMAMPNRKMPTIGDSTQPIAGMDDYYVTAEVGYRFYDLKAVGDYRAYREGDRNWVALLYGADRIEQHDVDETSSYLSSGWVSLRNTWEGNPAWVGLNALIPGGGHQHADRLGLLFYSRGELLALEKATPYNESVTRVLGTLSPMHNTVTVDGESQPQGEALTEEQVPKVERFYSGDWLQFAELRADNLYPQTSAYRRSVALIEDIVLDCFVVAGGETHDWMLHHGGASTALSIPMAEGSFEPADWLYNGTENVTSSMTDSSWEARWQVGGVHARLTMAGTANTEVFALETYPIANAVITKDDPPCQSLCVRRRDDVPYLAVWDAWKDEPSVRDVRFAGMNGVFLATTSHMYRVCFGPGTVQFDDGVSITTDGAFMALRDTEAVTIVGGQNATVTFPDGTIAVTAEEAVTCAVTRGPSGAEVETFPSIQFDTYQGGNHPRPRPEVSIDVSGTLWK